MNQAFKPIAVGLLIIVALITLLLLILRTPDKDLDVLIDKYADSRSQFVEIQDMEVHYKVEGNGPDLVLLHGTAASLHTWDAWTYLLKDSFRVIRLDLPAYGLTGPNPENEYSFSFYRNFLHDFFEQLGLTKFSLAGNSFGGALAWQYAFTYPDEVENLILLDAAGFPAEKPALFKMASNPIMQTVFKIVTPRSLVEDNIMEVYHDDRKATPAIIDRYFELSLRPGNRDAFVARVNTDYPDLTDQLSDILCPTLILWGEHDTWTPLENAYKFDSLMPNATLITYPNAGHIPMEEIPVETAKDATDFLLHLKN